jgi:hypothetical protein
MQSSSPQVSGAETARVASLSGSIWRLIDMPQSCRQFKERILPECRTWSQKQRRGCLLPYRRGRRVRPVELGCLRAEARWASFRRAEASAGVRERHLSGSPRPERLRLAIRSGAFPAATDECTPPTRRRTSQFAAVSAEPSLTLPLPLAGCMKFACTVPMHNSRKSLNYKESHKPR